MGLYIENGIAVNASWEGHIVTSNKANSWNNGFHKEDITVSLVKVSNEPNGVIRYEIIFKKSGGDNIVFRFNPEEVTNKAAWSAGATSFDNAYIALQEILGWFSESVAGATEATQLAVLAALNTIASDDAQIESPTVLTSSSTTGAGTIPAGSKAATVFIDGDGGEINGVVRPNGWSQAFEFNNDLLPLISYDGNGTAIIYVDILT